MQDSSMLRTHISLRAAGLEMQFVTALYAKQFDLVSYFISLDLRPNTVIYPGIGYLNMPLLWHAMEYYKTLEKLSDDAMFILDVIDILIEKGADTRSESLGWYPLDFAMVYHLPEIVVLLLKDPLCNVTDFFAETPSGTFSSFLEKAIHRYPETAIVLINDPRFDLMVLDENRVSLLQFAVSAQHGELVCALIEKGVPIDHQDIWGCTALHYAITRQNVNMVRLLLKHGASLSMYGWTTRSEKMNPYTFAVDRKLTDIVRVFDQFGFGKRPKESYLCA